MKKPTVASRQSQVDSRKPLSTVLAAIVMLCSAAVFGQGRGGVASFPAQQRDPADPAVVARGRAIYDTECRRCHGADLRGGEQGGSNLLRAAVVLNDREGELIQPVLQGSHKDRLPAAMQTPERAPQAASPQDQMRDDLLSALINLGYQRQAAEKALDRVLEETPDSAFEAALKATLRKLMKG